MKSCLFIYLAVDPRALLFRRTLLIREILGRVREAQRIREVGVAVSARIQAVPDRLTERTSHSGIRRDSHGGTFDLLDAGASDALSHQPFHGRRYRRVIRCGADQKARFLLLDQLTALRGQPAEVRVAERRHAAVRHSLHLQLTTLPHTVASDNRHPILKVAFDSYFNLTFALSDIERALFNCFSLSRREISKEKISWTSIRDTDRVALSVKTD